MSVSEKLAALDEAATPLKAEWTVSALTHIYGDRGDGVRDILIAQANWRRGDADLVVAMRNALPRIRALVEAAEKLWQVHGEIAALPEGTELITALADLDKALEEQT